MDPNVTLRTIRRLQKDLETAYQQVDEAPDNVIELGRELAQAVADLDGFLSRGGFLPSNWSDYPDDARALWKTPIVDSSLDVEVDDRLNIVLVMPAHNGKRRRQTTVSNVDRLHAQLEEARSFVRGQEQQGPTDDQLEQIRKETREQLGREIEWAGDDINTHNGQY